jgi:hypothetical protein
MVALESWIDDHIAAPPSTPERASQKGPHDDR